MKGFSLAFWKMIHLVFCTCVIGNNFNSKLHSCKNMIYVPQQTKRAPYTKRYSVSYTQATYVSDILNTICKNQKMAISLLTLVSKWSKYCIKMH